MVKRKNYCRKRENLETKFRFDNLTGKLHF